MSTDSDTLKKDIEQLRSDLAALAKNYKDLGERQASAGLDGARDKADQLRVQASNQLQDVGSEIEARPFTSVLAAFGIGLVLGKLIGR